MRLLSSLFIFIILLGPIVNSLNAIDWVDDYYGFNLVEIWEIEEERKESKDKTKFVLETEPVLLGFSGIFVSEVAELSVNQFPAGFLFRVDFPPESRCFF